MFQAKLRGWKRLAASLVLLPGLTAVGAEVLHLLGTAQAEERTAEPAQVDKATAMMRQARAAYDKGDYAKAQDLAEKIKVMNVGQPYWDDSPDQLLLDIKKKNGGKLPSRVTANTADPRILLKKANAELDAGNLDKAQDYARQADANSKNMNWGLFEDTPASVLKDIQKARSKRDRAEADRLLTKARGLYEKRMVVTKRTAATDEVRAAELDKAKSMALQAAQLHGPYGMFDLGDRPQSLIKDIDAARAKLNVARRPDPKKKLEDGLATAKNDPNVKPAGNSLLNPESGGVAGGTIVSKVPGAPAPIESPVLPIDPATAGPAASPYNPPEVAAPVNPGNHGNLRKSQAVALMAQAGAYQRAGKYVEAREALQQAQKQNAAFSVDEETPEMALQALMGSAQKHIQRLCAEAHELMVKKTAADVALAEKKLADADAAAGGLGLDRWAILEHRKTLLVIKSKSEIAVGVNFDPPALPNAINPGGDIPPSVVMPGVPTGSPVTEPGMQDQGAVLLRQAHAEFRAGSFDNARKMTMTVLNGNYSQKSEAQAFLRTIDAEEFEMKKITAQRSYEHAVVAYTQKNYEQALSIFKLIDPALLPPQKRASMSQLVATAARATEQSGGLLQAAAPGNPTVLPPPGGENSLLKQQEAMSELKFQKLRAKGLEVEASATARFGKGETDAALADLNNFIAEVRSSNIDQPKVALLVRPVESRIERLKVLKHQQDFLTKEAKDLKSFRNQMSQEALQKEYKRSEVAKLLKDFGRLCDEGKYQEAYKVAMKAKELDPEDPAAGAAMNMAHIMERKQIVDNGHKMTEQTTFDGIQKAMEIGPGVDIDDPYKFDVKRFNEIRNRPNYNSGITTLRSMSPKERDIESKLNSHVVTSLNFKSTPLDEVVTYMQTLTGMNFVLDRPALLAEGVDPKMPITQALNDIKLSSALGVILDMAKLRYIVTKDVVKITTAKGARGAMQRRTIPVADLVIPIQNYGGGGVTDLDTQLERSMMNSRPQLPGSATTPFAPLRGLNTGMGQPTGTPSLGGGNGGRLVNYTPGAPQIEKQNASGTIEEALIRLITNAVQPDTWDAMGGPGHIEYYPLGMALVINQTPDVIEEVIRLLESLRQLQDLEIAIEVRMITLAESFYERIGMDFSMNLNTHSNKTLVNLTNNNGLFSNFQNLQNSGVGKVIGLSAPGVPTPDLNVPINATSFGPAIPPFGGFPNSPGADGGVSLGLAFLSDVQVQMFLEAAQGDRRTNVMQAPKLTMFNGQSASLRVQDQQFFLTSITVTTVNGQLVFTPNNQPFPLGVFMNMQPVVSGDRRFVRLNIQQTMTNLASATVPLFPITTIVTPVFDGGAQGQPVPFTQYIQQPTFTTISVQTTVVVPDGGTVLLGGLKTLSEGRNEFGPPIISKIPYINRLFRNVGYGRDVSSLMMMVTPRIIINREEQERQTGVTEQGSEPTN